MFIHPIIRLFAYLVIALNPVIARQFAHIFWPLLHRRRIKAASRVAPQNPTLLRYNSYNDIP